MAAAWQFFSTSQVEQEVNDFTLLRGLRLLILVMVWSDYLITSISKLHWDSVSLLTWEINCLRKCFLLICVLLHATENRFEMIIYTV